jgi:hypothetical protein
MFYIHNAVGPTLALPEALKGFVRCVFGCGAVSNGDLRRPTQYEAGLSVKRVNSQIEVRAGVRLSSYTQALNHVYSASVDL